jgi:hypothetical protein
MVGHLMPNTTVQEYLSLVLGLTRHRMSKNTAYENGVMMQIDMTSSAREKYGIS